MSKPIEPVYRMIGARIEEIRGVLGLTQGELSKRLGISRASIANMEVGRQRIMIHDVDKIAAALGTTSKHFMKGIWL